MKKFYYHDGTAQQGPFDIEELKLKSLTKTTMIWYEGLPEWKKADEIDELKELFIVKTPPPLMASPPKLQVETNSISEKKIEQQNFSQQGTAQNINTKPKSSKNKGIIIISAIIGGMFFLYIISQVLSAVSDSGSEELSPAQKEVANPELYLNASGEYRENFLGTKIKVFGYVENNAQYTDYKDVVIKITFYSETETELGSENYIIYDYFPKGTKKEFNLNAEFPAGTKKCGWDAIGATAN